MSTPKHTLGTWQVRQEWKTLTRSLPNGEQESVEVPDFYVRTETVPIAHVLFSHEANAHLIAAAPKLLNALIDVLEEFRPKECNCDANVIDGRLVGYPCYFHRIEDRIRTAILAAEK